MEATIEVLDSYWVSLFWALTPIQFDQAFDNSDYKEFLLLYDINSRPVTGSRHARNVMESKGKFVTDFLTHQIK